MFNIGPTIPQERLESIPIQPETTRIEPTPHLGESYFNKLIESKEGLKLESYPKCDPAPARNETSTRADLALMPFDNFPRER